MLADITLFFLPLVSPSLTFPTMAPRLKHKLKAPEELRESPFILRVWWKTDLGTEHLHPKNPFRLQKPPVESKSAVSLLLTLACGFPPRFSAGRKSKTNAVNAATGHKLIRDEHVEQQQQSKGSRKRAASTKQSARRKSARNEPEDEGSPK